MFDVHVPSDSPDTARYKFLKRGHSQGHVTLVFWALVANRSRTVKATDCKQFKIYFCKNSLVGLGYALLSVPYTVLFFYVILILLA